MHSERFYTWIGLFVFFALALIIGSASFFYAQYEQSKKHTYVMFFKGSLRGLETATPVTYRGVKIGRVSLIEVTENKAGNKVMIPVYVEFSVAKTWGHKSDPIEFIIASGYVADISKPNFITGIADIELVQPENSRTNRKQTYFRGYPVFPTRNTLEKYTSLDESLKSADKMFKAIRKLVTSKEVKDTIRSTKEMADSLQKLSGNIDRYLPNSLLYFNQTLKKISDAANSTENLTSYLSRNPESLLRGKQ